MKYKQIYNKTNIKQKKHPCTIKLKINCWYWYFVVF